MIMYWQSDIKENYIFVWWEKWVWKALVVTGHFALTAGVMSGDLSEWSKALYREIFSISATTLHDSCPQERGSQNNSYMIFLCPKPQILRLPCPNTCTAEPSGCLEELSSASGDWLWFKVFSYLTLQGEERMGQRTQHCTRKHNITLETLLLT